MPVYLSLAASFKLQCADVLTYLRVLPLDNTRSIFVLARPSHTSTTQSTSMSAARKQGTVSEGDIYLKPTSCLDFLHVSGSDIGAAQLHASQTLQEF